MGPEDKLASIEECPDCASLNIVHSTLRDQIICRDCGLVFEPFAAAKPPKPVTRVVKPKKAKLVKTRKAKAKPKKAKRAKPKKVKKKAMPKKKKRRFKLW